jgi:hypothetical protein
MRFEKIIFCIFKSQFFKNAIIKWFIFYDLVLNRTFSLPNRNSKHTLKKIGLTKVTRGQLSIGYILVHYNIYILKAYYMFVRKDVVLNSIYFNKLKYIHAQTTKPMLSRGINKGDFSAT